MIKLEGISGKFRDEFFEKSKAGFDQLLARKDLGFLNLPANKDLQNASQDRANQILKYSKTLVVFGIGGSSLGGRVIQEIFGESNGRNVMFFENVDSRSFWKRFETLDYKKTHFVIVSKSGSTIETLAQAQLAIQVLNENELSFSKHFTVITELKESDLFNWANQNSVPVLEIPMNVGGRFSVLSPVGVLPMAFLGKSADDFLAGAEWALKEGESVSQLAAFFLSEFEMNKWITCIWSYSNSLKSFGLWIQQLWSESLAKRVCRSGAQAPRVSTPIPLVGTNDQHSILQQIVEGEKDKTVLFLRILESEIPGRTVSGSQFKSLDVIEGKGIGALMKAELQATQDVLHKNEVSNATLVLERIDAKSLGALFMYFQLLVGTLGEVLDINAFDQPGVELGKKLARSILMN